MNSLEPEKLPATVSRLEIGPKKRRAFPVLIKSGSVVAKVYRVRHRGTSDGWAYSLAYSTPAGRSVRQFSRLARAMEEGRLAVDQIAAGEAEGALMSKADRAELHAARAKAGALPLLTVLGEWENARELVGSEILQACEAWRIRKTKFSRISATECVAKFKSSFIARMRARAPRRATAEQLEKLVPKSYLVVLAAFKDDFGERMLDSITKQELDKWFSGKGSRSGWTGNTYRKRVVTMFGWARRAEYLPRDMVTEADQTERMTEDAPRRELTTPDTLARIMFFLQFGVDIENPDQKHEARPDLVPAIALSAFSGYRSIEGHTQRWEDIDLDDTRGNVTQAKRGTAADRATRLPACAIKWLQLTPAAERIGPIHGYKTEVQTIIRAHLLRTLGLKLPPNTLRKSWESYRVVLSSDDGQAATDEAGHTTQVAVKHYRNSRAKRSDGRDWFAIFPESLGDYLARKSMPPAAALG